MYILSVNAVVGFFFSKWIGLRPVNRGSVHRVYGEKLATLKRLETSGLIGVTLYEAWRALRYLSGGSEMLFSVSPPSSGRYDECPRERCGMYCEYLRYHAAPWSAEQVQRWGEARTLWHMDMWTFIAIARHGRYERYRRRRRFRR